MLITFKIRKVNDFFDKVLKEVSCKLRKVLHKSVESIKNSMKSTKICSKMSPSRKPANQPTIQINWLYATQREPKTKRGCRTDQSINDICDYII